MNQIVCREFLVNFYGRGLDWASLSALDSRTNPISWLSKPQDQAIVSAVLRALRPENAEQYEILHKSYMVAPYPSRGQTVEGRICQRILPYYSGGQHPHLDPWRSGSGGVPNE